MVETLDRASADPEASWVLNTNTGGRSTWKFAPVSTVLDSISVQRADSVRSTPYVVQCTVLSCVLGLARYIRVLLFRASQIVKKEAALNAEQGHSFREESVGAVRSRSSVAA